MKISIISILLLLLITSCFADNINIENNNNAISITNKKETININLANGTFDYTNEYKEKTNFRTNILNVSEWAYPKYDNAKPTIKKTKNETTVIVKFSVADDREYELTVQAYNDLPGFIIKMLVKNNGKQRGEYFFTDWKMFSRDVYVFYNFNPLKLACEENTSGEYDNYNWYYYDKGNDGILISTIGTVGYQGGDSYIHPNPRNASVPTNGTYSTAFYITELNNINQAKPYYDKLMEKNSPLFDIKDDNVKVDYGTPVPKWLRDADMYNLYYRSSADWTDSVVNNQLKYFPLVVGSTPDLKALEKCHKAGIKLLHYVCYTPLLDTKLQVEGGSKVYGEWLELPLHDTLDLSKHPDWILINNKGEKEHDLWGVNHGHMGQLNTCFHQQGLRDAIKNQVKWFMENGYDGIFIDLAGTTKECYGDKFNIHKHVEGKTNNDMYVETLKMIYDTIKSYGNDKILILNTVEFILDDYWKFSDGMMWEAVIFGGDNDQIRTPVKELEIQGYKFNKAAQAGKYVMMLSYFNHFKDDLRFRNSFLYAYCYARIFELKFADSNTAYDVNKEFAISIYSAKLGKPISKITKTNEVYFRTFEKGISIMNTSDIEKEIKIPLTSDNTYNIIGFNNTIKSNKKSITIKLPGKSGRLLIKK